MSRREALLFILLLVYVSAFFFYRYPQKNMVTIEALPQQRISTTTVPAMQDKTPKTMAKIEHVPTYSSSTAQVGAFIATVTCKDYNPVRVEIAKDGTDIKTLTIDGSLTGVSKCEKAEAADMNFDGYPDFMVPNGDGSGGASYEYWLFNTGSGGFYCPERSCELMNPEVNVASGTITSIYQLGAGTVVHDTYTAVDGRLVLQSSVTKEY